jgi:glycosyltransferase involved in cell wall biosynthesis
MHPRASGKAGAVHYVTVSDFVVKYAFEPAVGLANARNCGWRMARGDIVAFTDDDCYVASGVSDIRNLVEQQEM